MKTKLIIAGVVILFLYMAKKKKDAKKEAQKMEVALKANEMSAGEQMDIMRLKIYDFLSRQMPFMPEVERDEWVLILTTGLEEYKDKYLNPQYTSII
jgi:hypothetical protein